MTPKPLLIAFTLLIGLAGVNPGPRAQQSPNIILIFADDLGYEVLPAYGNKEHQTPFLDRMAAGGMVFENAHATPLCTPSRVQLMTGKYNFRNYIGFGLLDPGEKTIAHWLKDRGYATCVVGKWQLYGNARQQELAGGKVGSLPEEAGFDSYRLWQVRDLGSRYKNALLDTKGTGLEKFEGQYGPDLFTDYLEDFVEKQAGEPFFAYFPMALTHDPFEPYPGSPDYVSYDPEDRVNDPRYFPGMVSYMDKLVGRIINKVTELGLAENTLILFMGDNGTDRDVVNRLNGRELRGNKGYTNDLGTHVPLLAYWPGTIAAGSRNPNLIDLTDFLPTLLEVSGRDPLDQTFPMDGISFYPQLVNPQYSGRVREWVFCHYAPNWGNFTPRTFVYDTSWKYYADGEIYDLRNDPLENSPLQFKDLDRLGKKSVRKFKRVIGNMR
ncbi:sulfatase-like hydrolase/transferase [Cyclobacterium lianum]|uniref:sulfatase-like hydrolase/transferase n=1 Tax=Cyclobacterium lianum TaxID=388280 RepID=UPI001FE3548E|nr:sulfatase-like hydrolase/transferase [Cyclobacterium lianum]